MIMARQIALLCSLMLASSALASPAEKSWDFSVLLDGSKIGYHRFELTQDDRERRLTSEAKFDVRFLFINAFRYRHTNTEIWSDGCLEKIDASTRSNGKELAVSGLRIGDGFVVDDGKAQNSLDDCVMTFAYWNPDFLRQSRLLNPQTGEYLDVEVERVGQEPVFVRGEEIPASVYRIRASKLDLKLWYSQDDEWIALESVAKGGRILRYELT